MAHFAQLDENSVVINVVVVDDNEIVDDVDPDGTSEAKGIEFLQSIEGEDTVWVQTSYNTRGNEHPENRPRRRHYAAIGMTYDSVRDVFVYSSPYPSWVLNDDGLWEAPVTPEKHTEGRYDWDEENQQWTEMELPDQPFPSWTWNTSSYVWEPPMAFPADWDDDNPYTWDEENEVWVSP